MSDNSHLQAFDTEVKKGRDVRPQPTLSFAAGRGPHLVLTGFMGAGKSTVGKLLATRRGQVFVDLDEELERRAGRSIAQIFAEEGEAAFRDLETAVLVQLADELADAEPCVVATGGGVIERDINRSMLRKLGVTAWLSGAWPVLKSRIIGDPDGIRPLAAAEQQHQALHARWRDRQAPYAAADFVIEADQPPEQAAAALDRGQQAVATHVHIAVPLGDRSYTVQIGEGALMQGALQVAALAPPRALVVADSQVAHHWLETLTGALEQVGVPFDVHLLPAGEQHKHIETVSGIWDALLDGGADRGVVVIALGGGVTGDLAGFAAASALRGVRVVQLPTSLLAMVDASVGGKTGFNRSQGKNLVGAFHQPKWVGCDLSTLSTLPERERIAGLSEVVKVGVTLDLELFEQLEKDADLLRKGDKTALKAVIARAIGLKAAVVAIDEREGGLRRVLNFGHTVGHAIERATNYARYRHGEAIAIGIVAALTASVQAGTCDQMTADRVTALLIALGLPTSLPADISRAEVRAALGHDKKRAASGVRFVLCAGLGHYAERLIALDDIPVFHNPTP
ncbi:MAG: 3-dehydroquinate synthase [Myxococcales bacterium]|nr:3-dehydroquinate synthase [Myxococcales bacterium]